MVFILSLLTVACSSLPNNSRENDTSISSKKNTDKQTSISSLSSASINNKSKADYHFTLSEIYRASNDIKKLLKSSNKH